MSVKSKFRDLLGLPSEEFEEYEDDFELINKTEEADLSESDDAISTTNTNAVKKNNKVVNIHATTQIQVVLVKPERFEDASSVADHLNAKRTVVLNLESTNKDVSRRLIDFLSGVAYANNGQIKKVAHNTYIIVPYNVNVMGDLLDELESNGVFF